MAVPVRASGTVFDSAGTVTSLAYTKPAGLSNGDVLTVTLGLHTDSPGTVTAPSSWVLIDSVNATGAGSVSLYVYRKIITNAAGEPASYTWSWTNTTRARGKISRWTGASTTTPIDDHGADGDGTGGTTASVAALSLVRVNGALVLASCHDSGGGGARYSSWTAGSNGLTENEDSGNTVNMTYGEADGSQAASGTTGTFSATISASSKWAAVAFVVRELEVTTAQSVTASKAPAASLVRKASHGLSASLAGVATLVASRGFLQSLAATASSAATLARQAKHTASVAASVAASAARGTSTRLSATKAPAASLSVGRGYRQTLSALAGSLASVGGVMSRPIRVVCAALAVVPALVAWLLIGPRYATAAQVRPRYAASAAARPRYVAAVVAVPRYVARLDSLECA